MRSFTDNAPVMKLTPNGLLDRIKYLVKVGMTKEQAKVYAFIDARILWRDKHPDAKFPVWLIERHKNPVDPFTKKRVKRKSIKQMAGGTVSYKNRFPEDNFVPVGHIKVKKKRARKNPVTPLKKKKLSRDYCVSTNYSGKWVLLAIFKTKLSALEYAKAYSNSHGKQTKIYRD